MARDIHGVHEPLMHISKRSDTNIVRAILVRVVAILLALVVCGVVIVAMTGLNPVQVYAGIIDGAVGAPRINAKVFAQGFLLVAGKLRNQLAGET